MENQKVNETTARPDTRRSSSSVLLAEFYDFIEANKFAEGIDDIEDAVKQTTWVFLSRWQKIRVAFSIIRQSFR